MGHLRQRTKGSYQICIYGTRGWHYETVKGSRLEARRRMTELEATRDKGIPLPKGELTLGQHLGDWLEGHARTVCSLRTIDGYQSVIEHHLVPALGRIQLKELTPRMIQSYYGKKSETLSARTVQKHHRLLSQVLKHAVRQGILGRNVCDMVDAPSGKGKTMRTLTPGELEVLLERASDDRFYPIYYTAVSSGLRQAELLGLRWRDLELDLASLSVSQVLYKRRGICVFQHPKTERSRRRVTMTPKLALFLRDYKREQETLYLERDKILGLDDLVFSNYDGRPVDPGVLSHEFARIVKRAGLEHLRFHDLRHSCASLMLLRGVHPKIVSETLGHSSVAFTMDTYSHIISGMQEDAMALLNEVIPTATNGQNSPSKRGVHDGMPA